ICRTPCSRWFSIAALHGVLQGTTLCNAVEIFNFIEVPPEGGSGDSPARVIVDGLTRPFELAVSLLCVHGLTADIAEYIQVAAVLHTFNVLSSAPSTSAADRPVSLKDSGGGSVQFVLLLESIPPFLPARHAHTVTLRCLPSMGGMGAD
ncbi:putative leucine-rich repeat protein, partial [Trypanosoma cruzi]